MLNIRINPPATKRNIAKLIEVRKRLNDKDHEIFYQWLGYWYHGRILASGRSYISGIFPHVELQEEHLLETGDFYFMGGQKKDRKDVLKMFPDYFHLIDQNEWNSKKASTEFLNKLSDKQRRKWQKLKKN